MFSILLLCHSDAHIEWLLDSKLQELDICALSLAVGQSSLSEKQKLFQDQI